MNGSRAGWKWEGEKAINFFASVLICFKFDLIKYKEKDLHLSPEKKTCEELSRETNCPGQSSWWSHISFFAKRSHVKITYIYNHGGMVSLNRTIFAGGIALDTNWLNQSLWNLVQSNLYITATLRNRAIKALSSNINTLNKI